MRCRYFTNAWLIALLATLISATTAAAAPPSIYRATIEGSVKTVDTAVDTGLVNKGLDTFKVTGLRFKRVRHGKSVDKVSASYKVTAGKVTWTSTMTGGCQHSFSDSFPVRSVIGSGKPLQFDKYSGRWQMLAELPTSMSATIIQSCITRDGSTGESELIRDLPSLLSAGGKSVKQSPRATIRRTFHDEYSDKNSSYSATWKLTLKS
ncbi:MAG: hypothetical protein JHD02_08545 [Thermoleophilaceae bacterium]|nr:hypothetical protein [Thermoleophilaceae bacterium]